MKAAVWHGRQDVRIESVAEPSFPPPGQVQVKVAWCGICGTDLHEYTGGPLYIPLNHPHPKTGVQAPVIIGHEMSGTVVAVGEGVEDFTAGDRVAAAPSSAAESADGASAVRWRNAITWHSWA